MKLYVKKSNDDVFEMLDLQAETVGDVRRKLRIDRDAEAYLNWKRAPEEMRLISHDTLFFCKKEQD